MSLSFFKLYHASQYRKQLHGAEIAAEAESSLHAPPLPLLSTHPLAQQRLGRVLDDRRQSAVVVQQQNQLAVLQNRLFRPGLTLFTQTGGKRVCGAEQRKIEPLWSGVAPWGRRRKLAGTRVWCGSWGRVRVRSRPKLLHPSEPLRLFSHQDLLLQRQRQGSRKSAIGTLRSFQTLSSLSHTCAISVCTPMCDLALPVLK